MVVPDNFTNRKNNNKIIIIYFLERHDHEHNMMITNIVQFAKICLVLRVLFANLYYTTRIHRQKIIRDGRGLMRPHICEENADGSRDRRHKYRGVLIFSSRPSLKFML